MAAGKDALAAAPTAAYCSRSRPSAFSDHGSSSESRTSHVRVQLAPQTGRGNGVAQPGEQHLGGFRAEECPPGPGVDGTRLARRCPELARRDGFVATEHDDRSRAHVLLLADEVDHAGCPIVGEGLGRVFQHVGALRGRHRSHRGGQVRQPAGVEGEPAHHLERPGRVLLANGDPPVVAGLDHPPAEDVGDLELVGGPTGRRRLGPGQSGRRRLGVNLTGRHRERFRRLVPDALGDDRDELLLGIAKSGQPPAEHAAGVEAHRVVHPHRVGGRRVPVQDHRRASVVVGPGQADRKPELVGLAGRVAVQGEAAHASRSPPLVRLLQAGMGDDEPALVEHQVRDQVVAELPEPATGTPGAPTAAGRASPPGRARPGRQTAVEGTDQLVLVVARYGEGMAGRHHAHDQAEDAGRVGPSVDQVADENRHAPGRVAGVRPVGRSNLGRGGSPGPPAAARARRGSRGRRRSRRTARAGRGSR